MPKKAKVMHTYFVTDNQEIYIKYLNQSVYKYQFIIHKSFNFIIE